MLTSRSRSQLNIFPALRGGDFPQGSVMFDTETKDINCRVDIPVMGCLAVIARPSSLRQTCDTFRPRRRKASTRRTGLGSIGFIDDAEPSPVRNRFVTKELSEHRPASVGYRLRHSGFLQGRRTDVADDNVPVPPGDLGTLDVEKMPTLPADLGLQASRPPLLAAPLMQREFFLGRAVKLRRLDLGPVAQGGERLEAEINTDCWAILRTDIGQFDLNVDKPAPLAVAGKVPGLWNSVLRDWPRQPQTVGSAQEAQRVTVQSGRPLEVAERNPIEIAFEGTETRRPGKSLMPRIGKLGADRVHRVGMDTQFLGGTTAETSEIKAGRTLNLHAGAIPPRSLAVDLTEIVPDEVDRSRLSAKRPAGSPIPVLDAIAVVEDHSFGPSFRFGGSAVKRPSFSGESGGFALYNPALSQQQEGALSAPA